MEGLFIHSFYFIIKFYRFPGSKVRRRFVKPVSVRLWSSAKDKNVVSDSQGPAQSLGERQLSMFSSSVWVPQELRRQHSWTNFFCFVLQGEPGADNTSSGPRGELGNPGQPVRSGWTVVGWTQWLSNLGFEPLAI